MNTAGYVVGQILAGALLAWVLILMVRAVVQWARDNAQRASRTQAAYARAQRERQRKRDIFAWSHVMSTSMIPAEREAARQMLHYLLEPADAPVSRHSLHRG